MHRQQYGGGRRRSKGKCSRRPASATLTREAVVCRSTYTQAAVWYWKAAEQGVPEAQSNLGLLYEEGKGVPQDYAEAYFWLDLAVAQETQEEQETDLASRDDAAKKLTPEELMKVQERARKWSEDHPAKPQ